MANVHYCYIIECEFPLYVNERYCVQSCPSSKFGNHMTQQCESCKCIMQIVIIIIQCDCIR